MNAASRSDWPRAVGAIAALLLLCGSLLFLWGTLLNRRMTTVARLPRSTSTLSISPRLLPTSPLWAVVSKELSTWFRDPWRFGRIASQRLEVRGPELLNTMRHGTISRAQASQPQAKEEALDLPLGKSVLVGFLILFGILFTLPQGIVSLILKFTGVHSRGWFVALYLPQGLQIPTSLTFLLLGLTMLLVAASILRKQRKVQH